MKGSISKKECFERGTKKQAQDWWQKWWGWAWWTDMIIKDEMSHKVDSRDEVKHIEKRDWQCWW